MNANVEKAKLLASAMLDAGKEPIWVLMMMSAYYGEKEGREAALAVIEERESASLG
jgi:hypothetical protein